jgi:hypothetical protein
MKRNTFIFVLAATALLVAIVTPALASAPSGVTPTVLARGTYDAFKVMSHPAGSGLFNAEAKQPIDMVVRRHEYAAGGSTGWHAHRTRYSSPSSRARSRSMSATTQHARRQLSRPGRDTSTPATGTSVGMTGQLAVDVSVIMAPVGAPFREELDAPGPFCNF